MSGFKNQVSIQRGILRELARLVKGGRYVGEFGKPDRLALLGHSFGSVLTQYALAEDPALADAVILTGIGFEPAAMDYTGVVRTLSPRIAKYQDRRFSNLDVGYLTWDSWLSSIEAYVSGPFLFDVACKALTFLPQLLQVSKLRHSCSAVRRGKQAGIRHHGVSERWRWQE